MSKRAQGSNYNGVRGVRSNKQLMRKGAYKSGVLDKARGEWEAEQIQRERRRDIGREDGRKL